MRSRITGFKKAASILTLAFAAVAGTAASLEWYGYGLFDRAGGDNILCRADPYCRQLTEGEIGIARSFFGDSIDYRTVKLFNRPYMLVAGDEHGLSPNGNIYINGKTKWAEDYSKNLYWQSLFIHEMTHVWQVQRGRDVRSEAFWEFFKSDFQYETVYEYDIKTKAPYRDHNLEQQAEMIEDYHDLRRDFRLSVKDQDMTRPKQYGEKFNREAKAKCQMLWLYEAKIRQDIPLTPEAGCNAYLRKAPKTPNPEHRPVS